MRVLKRLLLLTCIALLYSLVAPHRLAQEPLRRVQFARAIEITHSGLGADSAVSSRSQPNEPGLLPFVHQDQYGYIDNAGVIVWLEQVDHGVALAATHYVNYPQMPEEQVVRAPGGVEISTLTAPGYPVLAPGYVYVISASQDGLTAYRYEGAELWSRRFSAPITDLDAVGDSVVVGLLDGTVVYLDAQGEAIVIDPDNESSVAVVYGVALSPDERTVAVLSGLYPQRLRVFRLNENQEITGAHARNLESQRREPAVVQFDPRGEGLLYEHGPVLTHLSMDRFEHAAFEVEGEVISIAAGGAEQPSAFVSRLREHSELTITAPNRATVLRERLSDAEAFVLQRGTCYLLAVGEVLICLEIVAG